MKSALAFERQLVAASVLGLAMLAAGCGDQNEPASSEIEITDDRLAAESLLWVNQVGLAQHDPAVWRPRLLRACLEGVWEDEVAMRLAAEFIEEDLVVSVRAEGLGPPSVESGAQALWIMAVNFCRDSFPEGEIEDGPIFP